MSGQTYQTGSACNFQVPAVDAVILVSGTNINSFLPICDQRSTNFLFCQPCSRIVERTSVTHLILVDINQGYRPSFSDSEIQSMSAVFP